MKVTVRDARAHDCGRMSRILRGDHALALGRVGLETHRTLRGIFGRSCYRKALLIDDELVGIGGVESSLMSPCGYVWLALSRQAHHYPLALIREIRKCLDEIMTTKRALVTTVLDGDEPALRLMAFLGFEASGFEGRRAHSSEARHRLVKYVQRNPELWNRVGRSNVVSFLYEGDSHGS